MKYLDEFRNPEAAQRLLAEIKATVTRPWALMEVCGGQTHSLLRNGIDDLLPEQVEMIHGPGCPVCVTPLEMIDRALAIAAMPNTIMCSFGDMLRVPGSQADLFQVRSRGGDVRVVYSPLDSVQIARDNPERQVVSSGLALKPPLRPTPWPSTRLTVKSYPTSRCWFLTCWCLPPSKRS